MIQKPEDYHKYNRICGVCSTCHPQIASQTSH
jgi:Ni,Fe-hydrogenase I large subunit